MSLTSFLFGFAAGVLVFLAYSERIRLKGWIDAIRKKPETPK